MRVTKWANPPGDATLKKPFPQIVGRAFSFGFNALILASILPATCFPICRAVGECVIC